MKRMEKGLGLLAAFCLMLVLLITAVEAVVYWDDGYFEKEYRKYQVTERVRMEMDDLLFVTEEMMDYLKGEREDLIVRTIVDGAEREFFNAKEKRHMVDVQGLFLGAISLRRAAVILGVACATFLLKQGAKDSLLRMLQWGIGLFLGGMAAPVLLMQTNFTKYFTCFHLIFFDNDDWILNPKTDLLINIVPEGFFRDTAFRIAGLFSAAAFLIWLGAAYLRKRDKK